MSLEFAKSVISTSTLLLPIAMTAQSALSNAFSSATGVVTGAVKSRLYDAALAHIPKSVSFPIAGQIAKFSLENSASTQLPVPALLLGAGATYVALHLFRPSTPPPVIVNITVHAHPKDAPTVAVQTA